jgi:hypothetical protein
MPHEVDRNNGAGPIREIAWRSDYDMARGRTKGYCNHVARNSFGQTYSGIEPILDDIDQLSLRYDFDGRR